MLLNLSQVLNRDECDALIAEARYQIVDMTTLTGEENYRVAKGTWLQQPLPILEKLRTVVSRETGVPVSHQEAAHVVCYDVGGEYKAHDDGFHPGEPYYEHQMAQGGQRTHSCMLWLNDGYQGGETLFPVLSLAIFPTVGDMLIWSNLTPEGLPDLLQRHTGAPVTRGHKWILIIWVRERG